EELRHTGLAGSLLGAVMLEERIAAARRRFGGWALPVHRPPRGPGGSAIVAQWGRPAAYAGAAMAIGLLSSTRQGRRLDASAFRALNIDRGRRLDVTFEAVTELGSIWGSAGAAAVIARAGRREVAGRAFGAAGTAWLLGQALKKAFRRPRPYD